MLDKRCLNYFIGVMLGSIGHFGMYLTIIIVGIDKSTVHMFFPC